MAKVVLLFWVFISLSVGADAIDKEQYEKEAVSLVKEFSGKLKPELIVAMQEGGPVDAVKVCSERAPKIAAELSAESGWEVKRVSLKPRNQNSAIADRWERMVLQDFDVLAKGHSDKSLLRNAAVMDGAFRFMQAQRVEGICLACHGKNIDANTAAALKKYYPDDKAQGYKAGDVRGAFSLSKKL